MYSVYIHTFPNGKRYIGVTSWKPELRWGSNGCNYKNPYMVNAIKKYGWDSVKHEIVAENLTVDEASELERKLIKDYSSANREYGYNISLGGVDNKICSNETKEKLRQYNLGKVMSENSKKKISASQKGRKHDEKTRHNMSIAQKKSFANGNNAFHSRESREKARLKLKGRIPIAAIQKATEAKWHSVINLETGIKYKSIKEAAEKNGINRSTIIRHCESKVKKQKWQYVKDYEKIGAEVFE